MPTPSMQTGENPSYKRGWLEIGPARRGGINQNNPNPGLTLRWPHPLHPYLLKRVRRPSLECEPSTEGSTGHQVLAAGKGRR